MAQGIFLSVLINYCMFDLIVIPPLLLLLPTFTSISSLPPIRGKRKIEAGKNNGRKQFDSDQYTVSAHAHYPPCIRSIGLTFIFLNAFLVRNRPTVIPRIFSNCSIQFKDIIQLYIYLKLVS